MIYTKRGDLTRYAFKMGMTQTRCFPKHADSLSAECYVRIESERGCGFRVDMSGRYARRVLYNGDSLALARKAYRSVNLADEHVSAAKTYFAQNHSVYEA